VGWTGKATDFLAKKNKKLKLQSPNSYKMIELETAQKKNGKQ
jgi:hypothetical protein